MKARLNGKCLILLRTVCIIIIGLGETFPDWAEAELDLWQGCYATTQLLGGKVKFILSNSGHIQAILNPPGNPKASYFVNDRYPADPAQWQARAQKRAGSWWEDWRDWLGQRSGEQRAAPRELGNEQYQPGTPAPGTYVFEP